MRMPIFKSILSAVVSIAPAYRPLPSRMPWDRCKRQSRTAVRAPLHLHLHRKTCPCCDIVGKCAVAIGTMSRLQLGPASELSSSAALFGHAASSGVVPTLHQGRAQRPLPRLPAFDLSCVTSRAATLAVRPHVSYVAAVKAITREIPKCRNLSLELRRRARWRSSDLPASRRRSLNAV